MDFQFKLNGWMHAKGKRTYRMDDGLGIAFMRFTDGFQISLSRHWPDKPSRSDQHAFFMYAEKAARRIGKRIVHHTAEAFELKRTNSRHHVYRLRFYFVWPEQTPLL